MSTICGVECNGCGFAANCKGCMETEGRPFGGECIAAECFKKGGEDCFNVCKNLLMEEINSLGIEDMPKVTELFQLIGSFVNLEYILPSGEKTKLLDDTKIYFGAQVEKENSDRCYGVVADNSFLLVCEYGCNGADPEIVVYKKRYVGNKK